MPHLEINGARLYYELTGSQGEPMFFVHGSWGDHHNWDRVVPLLSNSYRVFTYDRRGHSESTAPEQQGSVTEDVQDLAALIDHQGLAPAHIIGNSFGAAITLRLATQRPELFRSLYVHEPPLFGLLAEDSPSAQALVELQQRLGSVVALLEEGDYAAGAERFVDTIAFGPGEWARLPEPNRQTFIRNATTFLDESRDPEALTMDPSRLARFDRPALLSTGGQSPPLFRRVAEKLLSEIPNARSHHFPQAGHVPHLTHPQDYAANLLAFLAAV